MKSATISFETLLQFAQAITPKAEHENLPLLIERKFFNGKKVEVITETWKKGEVVSILITTFDSIAEAYFVAEKMESYHEVEHNGKSVIEGTICIIN